MTSVRLFLGLPLAAFVTLLLVMMMSGLIGRDAELLPPRAPLDLVVTPKIEPTEPRATPPASRRIEAEAPPPPTFTRERSELPGGVGLAPERGPGRLETRLSGIGFAPTIRPAPAYPEACAARGAEGVVVVRFDVAPDGTVINPEIVSSPDRCFDRAVLRAAASWKYPPTIEDGRAVMRRGVVERVAFELED